MPESRSAILITRPEPGATATAERVAALGLRPVVAPFLTITPRPVRLPPPGQIQMILVTSGNAISAIPASYRHLPLCAVGAATARRARDVGFEHVVNAGGDAHALAALVEETGDRGGNPLLLLTGRGQGESLAQTLRASGFTLTRRVVYAAEPAKTLPEGAATALAAGMLRAAMFFSAETARVGVRLIGGAGLSDAVRQVDALAIGQPAAVALQKLPWRRIIVAAQPNQDAMLALLHE